MSLSLLPEPIQSYEDSNGHPLNGGQLFTYAAGTTTPKATYQDAAGTIPNTNPIILNERGEATLYGSGNYRFVLKNSFGAPIWDRDNVNAAISASDLSGDNGATLIGYDGTTLDQFFKSRLLRVVDTISQLRALDKTKYTRAFVTGYYAAGDGGGGPYWYDASDTTSADNNGTIIVASDGARWKLTHGQSWASACQFGAKGDGTTDDTTAIQKLVAAMKGKLSILDAGKTFYMAGVLQDDTSYNNSTVRFDGLIKMKPDAGGSTFGGAWVGWLIKDAIGVTLIRPNIDGNRANMTQREQIFCIGVAGAINPTITDPSFTDTRGDCIYIGQSNWLSNSANPQNVRIGKVRHVNSALDGRNTISIISGTGIHIESVMARNSGGTVNGFIQPGGIDLEPDFGYQICSDIYIGPCDITTGGTAGLGVFGKSISGNDANLDWNCFDIRIAPARVSKIGSLGSALSAGPFTRVADLFVEDYSISYDGGTRGAGPVFDLCQRVDAKVRASNVTIGAIIGPIANASGCKFDVSASAFDTAIVRTTGITNSKVTARLAGNAVSASTSFGVQLHNAGRSVTQQDVTYNVHAPYDGVLARAFRNEPGNLVSVGIGCQVDGGDWSGYPSGVANDAGIQTVNVRGWNEQSAMPTSGTWAIGVFVRNVAPVQSGGKIMIGWVRLNTGANNVLNNDWSQVFATIS